MAAQEVINYKKELIGKIQRLGSTYSTWHVFEDFVAVSACAISNAIDKKHFDEREQTYLKTVGQYQKKEVNQFCEMLALLVAEMEKRGEPSDVLGEIYHELELHNKYKGQFFTPMDVCNMIGEINFNAQDHKTPLTLHEPCCGSGAMILGFTHAMDIAKMNYQRDLVVTALDIDIKCVHMCYVQLSLWGIPAVVIHGNALTVDEWSHWYTPAYIIGGFGWRARHLVEQAPAPPERNEGPSPVAAEQLPAVSAPPAVGLSEDRKGQIKFDF